MFLWILSFFSVSIDNDTNAVMNPNPIMLAKPDAVRCP